MAAVEPHERLSLPARHASCMVGHVSTDRSEARSTGVKKSNSTTMARKPRKREQALARKQAKRRVKRQAVLRAERLERNPLLAEAWKWPLVECIMSSTWRDTMQLTQILVARQSPRGPVAAAYVLVDLACLGVKNAVVRSYPSMAAYRGGERSEMLQNQMFEPCDLDLGAKVILEAIAYAKGLGFSPNKDTSAALKILGETHPENCIEEIPTGGPEGKPFYMVGPHDNAKQIMRTLDQTVGRDNYHFMTPVL